MILGRYHDIIHDTMISTFDRDGQPYTERRKTNGEKKYN